MQRPPLRIFDMPVLRIRENLTRSHFLDGNARKREEATATRSPEVQRFA